MGKLMKLIIILLMQSQAENAAFLAFASAALSGGSDVHSLSVSLP